MYSPNFERQFSYLVSSPAATNPTSATSFARGHVRASTAQTPEKSLAFAVKNTAFFAMTFMYAAADAGYADPSHGRLRP